MDGDRLGKGRGQLRERTGIDWGWDWAILREGVGRIGEGTGIVFWKVQDSLDGQTVRRVGDSLAGDGDSRARGEDGTETNCRAAEMG